jgi:hypothetical protein
MSYQVGVPLGKISLVERQTAPCLTEAIFVCTRVGAPIKEIRPRVVRLLHKKFKWWRRDVYKPLQRTWHVQCRNYEYILYID